ncbi:MAG: ATP-binding cassette domain-containing protein [wastewater metagenome]|nr:ATP-binding cassette domain-containing protein [Candidatus Loosdrechtia aerotolerans]
MIEIKNVSKSFDQGKSFAVQNVSLHVQQGEALILLGSSGCGKTTTLKMINRIIEPTSGSIYVDGTNVLEQDPVSLRRCIGYVFQGIGLFSHLTVEENVEIVPRLLGWPRDKRRERARFLLELMEISPIAYGRRLPQALSGGQKQRIGVARALAADPDYLLMDEPFGALDALTRDALQQELLAIKQKLNKTIIFVTHDIFEALTLADRIAVLHKGRLEQVGTKEEVLENPASPFVRDLFAKPTEQLAAFRRASP